MYLLLFWGVLTFESNGHNLLDCIYVWKMRSYFFITRIKVSCEFSFIFLHIFYSNPKSLFQVISTARTCNCILIVLDAIKPITHKRLIEKELEGFGIR